MNFFAQNLRAFKRCGLLLFVATVVTSQIDLGIGAQVESAIRNPTGLSNSVYFFGTLSLLESLLFPIILLLICLYALTEPTPTAVNETLAAVPVTSRWRGLLDFFQKNTNPLMIEILRSWGKTLQWSLLLILPGLVKYVQFILVPFVVTQSRAYDRGEADALEMSSRLVRKRLWSILGLIALFHLFIPLVFTSLFDEYRVLWQTPLPSLLLSLVEAYLYLMATQCFLWVFKKSLTEASL